MGLFEFLMSELSTFSLLLMIPCGARNKPAFFHNKLASKTPHFAMAIL
jgi:hypothetical protein